MKQALVTFLACAAVAAGFSLAARADAATARAWFTASNAEVFARSFAWPHEIAPANVCFDRAAGRADYVIVLPYRNDSRVRFIDATFADGKFVSAKMKLFGWEPENLSAEDFAKLREDFPMVAIRVGQNDVNPTAVLYPAKRTEAPRRPTDPNNLAENPVARYLGALNAGGLGVSLVKLAYAVQLRHQDGTVANLGVATLKSPISAKDVFTGVRSALEKKLNRPGQVSDRDVVDFRAASVLVCTAVEPPAPGKKGK